MVKTGCFRLRFSPRNQCIEYIWILGYNSGYLNLDLYAGFVTMSKINLDSPSICHQFVTGEIPEIGEKNRLENLQPRKWWKISSLLYLFLMQKRRSWIEPTYNQVCCIYHYISYFLIRMNHLVWLKTILVTFLKAMKARFARIYIYIDIGQTLARPIPIFQGQRAQGEDA